MKTAIRKSERTRQAILDSALEFLWSHPFRDLTVSELMKNTPAGRSAFYQYFADVHDVMNVLLDTFESDVLENTASWFTGDGDPISSLQRSLQALVDICYERGPLMRAVSDAAATDEELERSWNGLLKRFDDAIVDRIKAEQAMGLIPPFEARPVAAALNRMNAAVLIDAFGKRPRSNKRAACDAITRLWVSTLYPTHGTGKQPVRPNRNKTVRGLKK